jgi:hypothetical protein
MFRRTLLTLASAFALLQPLAVSAQEAEEEDRGSVGIRLLDAPTDRRDDPRAQTYIVDHVTQGTTITRNVEVSATTPEQIDVALYVGGARIEDGQFRFEDKGVESDLGDWSAIEPSTVTVPANGATQAAVTISVPSDADDGERYGVIWAELPGSGGDANVVNRVGVRIYLSVGEGEEPVTDFTIATLTARRDEDGTPIVETTVENTGGRAIDLSGSLQLTEGPGSLTAGPFNVDLGTTLGIGQTAPAEVRLDPTLPDGPWKATVTIESGRVQQSATATLTFPSEPGAAAEPVPADEAVQRQRKVLIPVAAGAVAVVGGAGAFFLVGRRKAAQLALKGARAAIHR